MSRPTPSATETLGSALVAAIASRDEARLRSLFATPVAFGAVTPSRSWEADTPVGVVDVVLGTWFDPGKRVLAVTALAEDTVGDVQKVTYRMAVATGAGRTVIEQVAYYDVLDGRITRLRLVCSGFRPAAQLSAAP